MNYFRKLLSSNKGFSLQEIMVVVAILAILATVAIPSYQGFKAKARQKEGLNMLSTYFQAAQVAQAQHGFFPGNLVATGFQPFGMIGYRLRAQNNMNNMANVLLNDNGCTITNMDCDCSMNCPNYKTWIETGPGVVGSTLGVGNAVAACPAPVTTDSTFTANVSGVINIKASSVDNYQINERKAISMCSDGLR